MILAPLLLLVLVVVLAVGLGMLIGGWRGVIVLAEPRCAKCGYDLRGFAGTPPTVCAECGTDLKAPKAVNWGQRQRRPRLMWAGAAMTGLPLLLMVAVVVGSAGGARRGRASRSNQALLNALASTVNQPWDWRELEQRYASGELSDDEAVRAVDKLIAHLQASPTPGQQPLSWSGGFVENVDKAGLITDEQFLRLARAFYGTSPTVRVSPSGRQGAPLRFGVDFASAWNLPGVEVVKSVRAVKLADGRELPLSTEYDGLGPNAAPPNPDNLSGRGPFTLDGKMTLDLPPGEHTLTFVVDAGVLKEGTAPQLVNGRPGQAKKWPRGRARWTMDVPVKVKVVPADQSPVELVTDPALDPQKAGTVKVKQAVVIRAEAGPRLAVRFEFARLPVAVSFDAFAKVAGREVPLGWHVATGDGRSNSTEHAHTFDALPPDVRKVDITLRPNPAHAERLPGIARAWGGVIELPAVPVERHDLDTGDAPPKE